MDITATPRTAAPCVGPEKDIQNHVVAKHAVPWPHVERWRRNVALAGYAAHTGVTRIFVSLLTLYSSIFSGVFFSTLDTTIIATALVSIVEELGSFWLSPWIVLAYLLTYMSKSPSHPSLAPP